MATDSAATDFLDYLLANAETAVPTAETAPSDDDIPILTNCERILVKGKETMVGIPVEQIKNELFDLTGGWPKRTGNVLFAPGPDYQPLYLDSTTKLFAWLDEQAVVDWGRSTDCVSQERLFENLRLYAPECHAIESVPHFPAMPAYYMHPSLPESDGSHLEALINFFTPDTDVDRELIKAFAMTLFWGGAPGKRPVFLITGPDHDSDVSQKGRGVGKTTLVTVLSQLVGGMITFSPQCDIEKIKTRLLSPSALQHRLAVLDNLKTLRFSWADFEGLITTPVISGHRMYHGEGRRINNLIWALTLNGATLSKDMAQRCCIIKVNRPEYDPEWQPQVKQYIQEFRWHIISDIQNCLIVPNQGATNDEN